MAEHGSEEIIEVHKELSEYILESLKKMDSIWKDIGIYGAQYSDRLSTFSNQVKNLITDMDEEETGRKEMMLQLVETYNDKISTLCEELCLPLYKPPEGLSLLHLEKNLRCKMEEYTKLKNERLEELKKLKDQLHELTTRLCCKTYPLSFKPGEIPAENELQELVDHILYLEKEKEKRLHEYKTSREKILQMYEELDDQPSTPFERTVFNESEMFLLSSDNIACIKKLEEELCQQLKKNEEEAYQLREKISLLWNRLQIVDEAERESFLKINIGHHPSTIKALKDELKRCEDLKNKNLKIFIEKIREELKMWWEKCLIAQKDQDVFRAFYNDSTSDDLLELHELEVQKLKLFYDENKKIFETIKKWEQMWNKMLELEERANDPNRFVNRGGGLIQEEKQRKEVNEKLPELEKKLEQLVLDWEKKHDSVFRINGLTYVDFIDAQKTIHEQQKENRILERKKQKAKLLEQELFHGCKPVTPGKRMLSGSTIKTPNKILKVMNTPMSHSKTQSKTPIMKLSEKVRRGQKRRSRGTHNSRRHNEAGPSNDNSFSQSTVSGNILPEKPVFSNAGTYNEFAMSLKQSQVNFNSTECHHPSE